ncbi:MAG: amidohydrolase family protein [Acidobacteria bacterium]|nr:amidohydrolase family protein [Acidobacteriota bacterium]MBI3280278.1 amidohydrolase family protein [Acidobacteriota bacterium]
MHKQPTRREWSAGIVGLAAMAEAAPRAFLIETHLHLFDPKRFPYHPNAVYRPEPRTLQDYVDFVRQTDIRHTVIVHPEPYQDDHRYLEFCFEHEPSPGFFKGTCLFDGIAPDTPARMERLVKKWPGRIVALRVHATAPPPQYPTRSGAIRERDLAAPEMRRTWAKAADLGLAVQMHMIPRFAPQVRRLASQFRSLPVVIDHLSRAGQGTPAEYEEVLRLGDLPRVYMKFSGVRYSSKQPHPHADAKPLVKRTFQVFGAERMIWGVLGTDRKEHAQAKALFDFMFDEAGPSRRALVAGETARKLYRF